MRRWLLLLVCLLLQACGGGGDATAPDDLSSPQSCSIASQRQTLRDFMQEQYYWYRNLGAPDDSAASMDAYFQSMLYRPTDRFSYSQSTAAYEQLFTEGRRVGYGYALSWTDATLTKLRVRYVEPLSPIARAGLRRGDTVLAIDGHTPVEIAAGVLPIVDTAGVSRTLTILDAAGQQRQIRVSSEDFALSPVLATNIFEVAASASPVKVGYLAYNQFVTYSMDQLAAAFGRFADAGVGEVILDLRYNGGGSVAVSRELASMIGGSATAGQLFASLRFNDKQPVPTSEVRFTTPAVSPNAPRVFVITSPATASASELVINGLRPYVKVVLVGETTYGKPYGFVPREACGITYEAVNFESFNAAGVGGYIAGFAPDCQVADDLDHALGDAAERRTATALSYVTTGRCTADSVPKRSAVTAARPLPIVGEDWPNGMFVQ